MKLKIFFSFSFLFFSILVFSQDSTLISNVDEAFREARELGFNGKRKKAIKLSKQILVKSPRYADVKIFLGRLYVWESQYDSARVQLLDVLTTDNKNEDAYLTMIDCELYDNKPFNAYAYSIEAIRTIEKPSEEIYFRKAKALYDLFQYEESLLQCTLILENSPNFEKVIKLKDRNLLEIRKNKISANYIYDNFNKTFKPWYGGSLAYARKTEIFGTSIARINYAERFNKRGYQYEIDLYPTLIPKTYSYINFGYSNYSVFSKYRAGFSIYKNFPKSFEGEIGIRWLRFNENIFIYTGSISKYYRSFWFSLRPFFIPQNSKKISASFLFNTRYYFIEKYDYIGISGGYGLSPDEKISSQDNVRLNTIFSSSPLKSYRLSLEFSRLIKNQFFFDTSAGIRYDEIRTNDYRINYTLNIGFGLSFK